MLIATGLALISTVQPHFQQMLQAGEEDDHHPVDQRHRHEALEELEGGGRFHLGLAHDLRHPRVNAEEVLLIMSMK